jgi:hypothetical protein
MRLVPTEKSTSSPFGGFEIASINMFFYVGISNQGTQPKASLTKAAYFVA